MATDSIHAASFAQSRFRALIADDQQSAREAISRLLEEDESIEIVSECADGREALAYLNGEGKYASSNFPMPALVLLDLSLPKLDGFDVLRCIRQQPHLDSIPVVVLTSSRDPSAAKKAYALGANSFLSKPADFQDTVRLILLLVAQWLPAGSHRRDAHLRLAA